MLLTYFYALLSGALSGGALGLTGGGGSILAVPLLVYVVGENIHLAIGTSLVAVGITSLISSVGYMRQSLVKFKIAFYMAAPGLISTYLGALINKQIKGPVLLLIFAVLMIYIGYLMFAKKKTQEQSQPDSSKINYPKILGLGFITGLASGFFGIGGGFLLVPALFLGARLKMKEAIATSLFIIFLFGMFGLGSYLIQGRQISLLISAIFVAGGSVGGVVGAYYARRINQVALRRIFSVFIILIGISIFIENLIQIL
ncbi:MAG: sulfite exporter TauE/SafE family protein [Bacteroidales bacterium]|nr:sulfite exporter TauE/SafE family protein [Bacteroidales bacterium]